MVDSATSPVDRGGSHPNRCPRRRRGLHDAQDAARPRGGAILCREEYARDRFGRLPRSTGRTARTRDRRQGVSFRRPRCRVSRRTPSRSSRTRSLRRRAREGGFRNVSGGTRPHGLLDLREFDEELTQARPRSARSRRHHDEPQHHPRRPRSPFVTSGLRVGSARKRRRHERGGVRNDRDVDVRALRHATTTRFVTRCAPDVAAMCATFNPTQLHEAVDAQHSRLRRRHRVARS